MKEAHSMEEIIFRAAGSSALSRSKIAQFDPKITN
jgi:hypothetical protein